MKFLFSFMKNWKVLERVKHFLITNMMGVERDYKSFMAFGIKHLNPDITRNYLNKLLMYFAP